MVVNDDLSLTHDQLCSVQQQLRANLQSCPPTELFADGVRGSYPEQHQQLQELISRALVLGESNSALIVGPRGVGKTALLRVVLSDFTSCVDAGGAALTAGGTGEGVLVRLNGLMQTDDRQALREITRQLRMEDCLATKQFGSFSENLTFLLASLKEGRSDTSKCVVFVLEEFDLFCHHRNQTLLYNLFDVAQSKQSPVCVIGVTCRLDAVELLEKRVRSRFSHRQLHVPPLPLTEYTATAVTLLSIRPSHGLTQSVVKKWNEYVEELFEEEEEVTEVLEKVYEVSRDVAMLKQLLMLVVSGGSGGRPTPSCFLRACATLMGDAVPAVLQGLSTLQLCLMIAMLHLTLVYHGEGFNFSMVYHEYLKFTRRRASVQSFERPVLLKAFDQLQCLELVLPCDGSSRLGGVQKEYRLMRLQVPARLLQDTLTTMPYLPTDMMHWAASALS